MKDSGFFFYDANVAFFTEPKRKCLLFPDHHFFFFLPGSRYFVKKVFPLVERISFDKEADPLPRVISPPPEGLRRSPYSISFPLMRTPFPMRRISLPL